MSKRSAAPTAASIVATCPKVRDSKVWSFVFLPRVPTAPTPRPGNVAACPPDAARESAPRRTCSILLSAIVCTFGFITLLRRRGAATAAVLSVCQIWSGSGLTQPWSMCFSGATVAKGCVLDCEAEKKPVDVIRVNPGQAKTLYEVDGFLRSSAGSKSSCQVCALRNVECAAPSSSSHRGRAGHDIHAAIGCDSSRRSQRLSA